MPEAGLDEEILFEMLDHEDTVNRAWNYGLCDQVLYVIGNSNYRPRREVGQMIYAMSANSHLMIIFRNI